MNRSGSKRVTRKKVIPKHFQKSQTSLSQILTAASYKKRIKELQKNNKVLAVALQDTRVDLANSNNLLHRCSNDETKILHARTKLKNMVECIQTLVTGLNEVMCCLDIKSVNWFNSSQDEVRLKIRRPDLDPIEESDSMVEDPEINISVSDKNPSSPVISELKQALVSDQPIPSINTTTPPDDCSKEILDIQKDLSTTVEDKNATTGRSYKSVPHVSPPDSPLTPELDIPHSADYFQQLLGLGIISCLPENVTQENKANPTSLKESKKTRSRIPLKANPLPVQPIEFSPPLPKLRRKTFVLKDAGKSSGMIETSVAQSITNLRDRRGTYTIASVQETISPPVIAIPSEAVKMTDATIHFSEDMELTNVIPIHKITPVKNYASKTTTFCKEDVSVAAPEYKTTSTTLSKDDTSKLKCPDVNQDMEFTCVLPVYSLPISANNALENINVATACANDPHLSKNVSKSVDNNLVLPQGQFSASSNPAPSKFTYDKQDSAVPEQEKPATVSKDDSPTFTCPDDIGSPVKKESLKRSSKSLNQKLSLKTKGKKISNYKKRSSVGFKNPSSPKSPKMSEALEALEAMPQNEQSSNSRHSRKDSARKRSTMTFAKYILSDSDNEDESEVSDFPGSQKLSPSVKGSLSSKDPELNSDDNCKGDSKVFGRCNLKSPRKTSKKRGPYKFEKSRKSSKMRCDQSGNGKKSAQTMDLVSTDYITSDNSLKNKQPSPQMSTMPETGSPKENVSPLLESAETSNKSNCKNRKPTQKLKFLDEETAISKVIVSETKEESCNKNNSVLNNVTSLSAQTHTRKSMAVSSPCKKNTVTVSNCRKSVQFAFNECYDAFQNINDDVKSKATEKNNRDSERHSSRLSTVPKCGILKNRLPSRKKQSQRISHNTSNSVDNIEHLPEHSPTRDNRLDEILATLDSTINEDDGCNSKNKTDHHDLASQSPKQEKRPFSGVSERTSKKRATDYSSDVFNEIETMCPPEISPRSLGTAQQCPAEKAAVDCEVTEVYDLKDIIITTQPETKPKKTVKGSSQTNKKIDKQKPIKEKNSTGRKTPKIKSKNPTPTNRELTEINQNVQSSALIEPLPICLPIEDNSFMKSKDSTSLGNERSKRARPQISMKERSLNCKLRR